MTKADPDINDTLRSEGAEGVRHKHDRARRFNGSGQENEPSNGKNGAHASEAPQKQPEHALSDEEYIETEDAPTIDPEKLKALRITAKKERAAVLDEFNSQYMVVYDNGQAWILRDTIDDTYGRQVYNYMKTGDLTLMYANREVCTRVDSKGRKTKKNVVAFWNKHPERRQYIGGVIFDPSTTDAPQGKLNLWRGFGVMPKQGSWDKLRDHICTILCGGNQKYFDYTMGWMARLVQQPHKQGEVSIVLRGDLGSGKGTLGHALRKLFGQHGMHISNSKHLVGNFNAHLRDCVFLFADEAFFAGDKQGLGTLKSLITEPVITVEGKFKNAIQCKNRLHVLMASDNEWVVPAAISERRFFVLDVKSDRLQDTAYFTAINEELENGGYEAMLYDLLHYDIGKFNVRAVPETAALQDQKTRSLSTDLAWWNGVLHHGYVYESKLGLEEYFGQWHEWVATRVLYKSYSEFAKSRHERHMMDESGFGRFMVKLATPKQKRHGVVGEHMCPKLGGDRSELVEDRVPHGYALGTLDQARAAFEAYTKLTYDWTRDELDD